MSKKIIFSILIIAISFSAVAQKKGVYQSKFNTAVDMLKGGQYSDASKLFKELQTVHKNNIFVEQSYYYYALAQFNLKELLTSRQALDALIEKYDDWRNIHEAYYLKANIAFEQKNFEEAFQFLDLTKRLNTEKKLMRDHYIYKSSIDELMELNAKFTEDKGILLALLQKLKSSKLTGRERMFLEFLIQEYKLDRGDYIDLLEKQSIKKEVYRVAVMLPFSFPHLILKENLNQRNFKYYELFQGIEIAKDSLEKEGVQVELFTYDTKKDTTTTKALLALEEMKTMDLIIGPIVYRNSTLVADFAELNMINYVNPVSSKGHEFYNRDFTYYMEPDVITVSNQVANYTTKNFKDEKKNNVLIYYNSSKKDSLMAATYKERMDSAGFDVKVFHKISRDNTKDIMNKMRVIRKNTINHIYFCGNDLLIGSHLIHPVEELDLQDVPVIVSSDFLQISNIEFEQFKRRNFIFVYPSYTSTNDSIVLSFRQKVKERMGAIPLWSKYASYGFESMYYFGKAMYKHGNLFNKELEKEPIQKGILNYGIHFGTHSSNQVVPLLKFDEDYNFEWLNNPFLH